MWFLDFYKERACDTVEGFYAVLRDCYDCYITRYQNLPNIGDMEEFWSAISKMIGQIQATPSTFLRDGNITTAETIDALSWIGKKYMPEHIKTLGIPEITNSYNVIFKKWFEGDFECLLLIGGGRSDIIQKSEFNPMKMEMVCFAAKMPDAVIMMFKQEAVNGLSPEEDVAVFKTKKQSFVEVHGAEKIKFFLQYATLT